MDTAQTQKGLRGSVVADPLRGLLHRPAGAGLSPTADVVCAALAVLLLALASSVLPTSIWVWTALSVVWQSATPMP